MIGRVIPRDAHLQATNRLGQAEPLMKRALAIDEASFGPNHPNVARDLNNLGMMYEQKGKTPMARFYLRRALAIFEASLGPDHPYTQGVAGNLLSLG